MPKPRKETIERFSQRYSIAADDIFARIEREVIGGVFGANGYTTKSQADELVPALALDSASRLLDLGSGRGWPGLYLSQQSGCEVVLVDAPEEGLRSALERASSAGISNRATAVRAVAEELPFARASFDAITHTDVL